MKSKATMKIIMRKLEYILALLVLAGTSICHGWEGDPIKLKRMPWYMKRGFTPLQIFTSSDLVGQGRLDAFRLIPEVGRENEFQAIATISFTNVLKGEAGPCDVYVSIAQKVPEYADISSLPWDLTEEEKDRALKSDWKWQEGKSYTLVCVSNPAMNRWELHSVVTQKWPDYVRILQEKIREYARWNEEKEARERGLSIKLSEHHDSMRLGDISSEEYEQHFDEYRVNRKAIDQEYQHHLVPCFPDGADGRFGGPIDWGRLKGEFGGAQ